MTFFANYFSSGRNILKKNMDFSNSKLRNFRIGNRIRAAESEYLSISAVLLTSFISDSFTISQFRHVSLSFIFCSLNFANAAYAIINKGGEFMVQIKYTFANQKRKSCFYGNRQNQNESTVKLECKGHRHKE